LVTEKAGYTKVKTPIDAYSQTNVAIVLNAGSTLPPVTNYSAMGPYEVMTETEKGPDGSYTVFRPRTLGANGFLHAPITFGPGTDMQVSQLRNLLERIASHGFVVISRQLTGGPGDAVTRQRLIAGLEWIIAQNTVAGSVYQGKIAVTKGVAMGYSVGATGSIEIGGHAALATIVAIHGHSAKGEAKVPMLLIGGTNDLNAGQSWLAPSYAASTTQTFFSLLTGANHGYIQTTVNGVQGGTETPSIIAWIRYWIYNDQGAKNYFYGDDCVMCKSPWSNTQRKNWQ
jgi:dienelactone hydrolase